MDITQTATSTDFVRDPGERVRSALVAGFGPDVAADATAEALEYAWEHWHRLAGMENPAGYVNKVGQSRAKRISCQSWLGSWSASDSCRAIRDSEAL